MVVVAGKPIISHILDQYSKDYDRVVVVYGSNEDLPNYIRLKYPDVILARQEATLGPLHAIWSGMKVLEPDDGPLTIWLGDTIVTDFIKSNVSPGEAIVVASEVEDWSRWCMIDTEGKLYDKPINKPRDAAAALVGIYCLPCYDEAFQLTDEIMNRGVTLKNEFQISQLLNKYQLIYELTNHWYDCGELHSLYESNAALISDQSCTDNQINVDVVKCTLTKSGSRCKNEAFWYKHVPNHAAPFIPNIYDIGMNSVTMDFIGGTSIQNMLVYEELPEDAINFLMKKVFLMYESCFFETDNILVTLNNSYEDMWIRKNIDRVINYQYDFVSRQQVSKYVSHVQSIKNELSKAIKYRSFVHGDLHLGNLMFSPMTSQIKMIDPRGIRNGVMTMSGDNLYDIVKLYQSVYGEYIWIHSGVPKNQFVYDCALRALDEYFSKFVDVSLIKKLVPVMMGSILEFHTNDLNRQKRVWQKTMELI